MPKLNSRLKLHLHRVMQAQGDGGAPLNYADLWEMLSASGHIAAVGHNLFNTLNPLKQERFSASVENDDVVLCNAGPYAHFYHYFRERSKRRFRIVRDARTCFWGPYLLQELLCAPLLRAGDILIVPSAYAAAVYRRLFPHLRDHRIEIAYPLKLGFSLPPANRPRPVGGPLRLGYLGRL